MKHLLNSIVEIKFYDHALHQGGGHGMLEIFVYGKVVAVNKTYIHVSSFYAEDDSNQDGYSINRKCILHIRRLK